MILLWGIMEDEPMAMAHAALQKAGAEFFFLDHRKLFTSDIECKFGAGTDGRCTVTVGSMTVDLESIRAAYVRGYNFCDYEEMQDKSRDDPLAQRAAGFEMQLIACLDASPALILNRSEPSATNGSKPYQLTLIRQVGLRIPETFISNDASAVRKFLSENQDFIYKSISGVRSIVRRVSDAHLGFIDDVNWCPTLFQRVVPGTNYRAHVLDGQVFAARIESSELDYRYGCTTMTADELPVGVAQKCLEITSKLGLHFSGVDLMRTPNDEWYCFEVNPSPAYSYFERESGLPISSALAKFLMEADRRKKSP
jgi:glutathione synthase/RimK-type ligase-like ATP-grasp enzyme